MAGYSGYSMSNNAVHAYDNNEMPLSKWTKAAFFEALPTVLEEQGITPNFSIELLKTLPWKTLKLFGLSSSSWHHTSNHYNKTDFYSIDFSWVEELTDTVIKELLKRED